MLKGDKGLAQFLKLVRGCTIQEIVCSPGRLCRGFNCQNFTSCLCGCMKAWGAKCVDFNFICSDFVVPGFLNQGDVPQGNLEGHRIAVIDVPDGSGGTRRCIVEGQFNEIIKCFDSKELKDQLIEWKIIPEWLRDVIRNFYLNHKNPDIRNTFAFLKNCGGVSDPKNRPAVIQTMSGYWGKIQRPIKKCCYCRKGGGYGDVYNKATGPEGATAAQCKEACEGMYGADQDEIKIIECDANTPTWPRE
jgi:hypothetical protein